MGLPASPTSYPASHPSLCPMKPTFYILASLPSAAYAGPLLGRKVEDAISGAMISVLKAILHVSYSI